MQVIWEGITKAETLKEAYVGPRQALADAARRFDWETVFEILEGKWVRINSWRLGGRSWYTPLHQAAYGGAPVAVVERMLALGAWRALPTAWGRLAGEIAAERGHTDLVDLLRPVYRYEVDAALLAVLQARFWEVIEGRVGNIVAREGLRLPELRILLELEKPEMWFPVPGMYGGFSFGLVKRAGEEVRLVSESWIRIVGGSGQRHEVTR
ncbi:MAG TPA: ankyrin repeat domain-containing protein, partial [Anaerolineae bacterium]|nr:ankyrin repeat domain-containing protein [Anaerolineae bacterium]